MSKAGSALRLDAISGNMARSLTVWGDTLLVGSGAAHAERVASTRPGPRPGDLRQLEHARPRGSRRQPCTGSAQWPGA
ncbi:MAG: hypothetical protein IPG96_21350 [Proteobacteria bacterium]|nr:hypothetical protein [Pseudomonadota bacterium]